MTSLGSFAFAALCIAAGLAARRWQHARRLPAPPQPLDQADRVLAVYGVLLLFGTAAGALVAVLP